MPIAAEDDVEVSVELGDLNVLVALEVLECGGDDAHLNLIIFRGEGG